jgi:hypothetical protein
MTPLDLDALDAAMAGRTQGKWAAKVGDDPEDPDDGWIDVTRDGVDACIASFVDWPDARAIAAAVNAHDALSALARAVVRWREASDALTAARYAYAQVLGWSSAVDAARDAAIEAERDLLRLAAGFTTKGDTGR